MWYHIGSAPASANKFVKAVLMLTSCGNDGCEDDADCSDNDDTSDNDGTYDDDGGGTSGNASGS